MELLGHLSVCAILYLMGEGFHYYYFGRTFTMDMLRSFKRK